MRKANGRGDKRFTFSEMNLFLDNFLTERTGMGGRIPHRGTKVTGHTEEEGRKGLRPSFCLLCGLGERGL
jgi:hypothetical protein